MAIEIATVPDLGGAETVNVIELSLAIGDAIEPEDALLVLESDKATMDVPSPYRGQLVQYLVAEGDEVKVGQPVAEVEISAHSQPVPEPTPVEEQQKPLSSQPAKAMGEESISTGAQTEQVLLLPDIGCDDKVEVIEISVAVGDQLDEGETLLVLESDKATMDIPSSRAGTIVEILVSQGDKLSTGDRVAIIRSSEAGTDKPVEIEAPEPVPAICPAEPTANRSTTKVMPVAPTHDVYAGPAVRLLARELGVNLSEVSGTGPRGRIQKDDISHFVKKALQHTTAANTAGGIPAIPAVDFSQFGEIDRVKLNKIQKITADNMQRNWLNVPHVTQFDEADITLLEDFRQSLKNDSEKRGVRITPAAFIIKAIAHCLRTYPEFNRCLAVDQESYIQKHYVNVGLAVDTPRGLLVPVIKQADEKGIWDIATDIMSYANSAREGRLKPSDMQGGCFTLSSLGAIGGNGFTPIVNSPEAAILGVSKSQIKPFWTGSEFEPRLMLPLALSYDHRLINGGDAGRFMTHLVKLLSDIRHLAV